MANKCIYFVEGPCEEQLINALKEVPQLLFSGKVKVFNVVQNLIPKSTLFTFTEGTTVILVFDTDVHESSTLKKNIISLKKYCCKVKTVFLPQVLTLEDELERATDVRKVTELTKSKSTKDFKSDFCKLKTKECRNMLDKHKLNIRLLWETIAPKPFTFIQSNGKEIKIFS
jgi:hypothetical protein